MFRSEIAKTPWKTTMVARIVLLVSLALLPACGRTAATPEAAASASQSESVYKRVLRTGAIRSAYASYPPYCIKDTNTGKMNGLMVEVLEAAANRLGLRVEWTEEVGWGTIFEGLASNRYDLFGAGVWRNASRGKVGDFSRPVLYNVIKAYGRADETRFRVPEDFNTETVRVSTQDGAMDDLVAKADFPKAKRVSLPQLSPWTDVLLNITTRKADVTFAEPGAVNLFLEKNPGALKELLPDRPLRAFGLCFAFKIGEGEYRSMFDSALEEIINDGTVDRIIRKYEKRPGELYRVASPYQR